MPEPSASTVRHRTRSMTGRDPDEPHRASTPLELLFDLQTLDDVLAQRGLAAPEQLLARQHGPAGAGRGQHPELVRGQLRREAGIVRAAGTGGGDARDVGSVHVGLGPGAGPSVTKPDDKAQRRRTPESRHPLPKS